MHSLSLGALHSCTKLMRSEEVGMQQKYSQEYKMIG